MMARQILFRGKDIKSGKWRVGSLVDLDGDLSGQVFIVPMFSGASSIPVRVTMTENTLELVSRVFLLVLPLYSENSELFYGKIFLRIMDFWHT